MDSLLKASQERAWFQLERVAAELEEELLVFTQSQFPDGWRTDYAKFSLQRDSLAVARKQIVDLRRRVNARLSESLHDDFADMMYLCRRAGLDVEYFTAELSQALAIVVVSNAELLYEAPKLVTPQLVVPISDALIVTLAKAPKLLYEISSRQFEELVGELFRKEGFDVELTRATRDGGVDIIAVSRRMNIWQKLIVECKRYAPQNRVGIAIVQRLLGVKDQLSANKAIVVTTSTFTREAQHVAQARFWDLDLKAYDDVVDWLKTASSR